MALLAAQAHSQGNMSYGNLDTAYVSPSRLWATYIGDDGTVGSSPTLYGEDKVRDVVIDTSGNVYVTGGTANDTFPVLNADQGTYGGGNHDVFVAKYNAAGVLQWSTFLGGGAYDRGYAIELDGAGNVYVAGRAGAGFPTTSGVVQETFAGDNDPNALYGTQDGFIAKYNNSGVQQWSTYFGDVGPGYMRDLAVDASGNIFLTLVEDSASTWVTGGAFQTSRVGAPSVDAVVCKLNSTVTAVTWCSYISGSGLDIGTPSIRVDSSGYVYVTGGTTSTDLPGTSGSFSPTHAGGSIWDMALYKFASDGASVVYAGYIGGTLNEYAETHGLVIDATGRAIVAATTTSTDFPVTGSAYQGAYGGACGGTCGNYGGDGFAMIVSADGSTVDAATYFGGTDGEGVEGVALGPAGEIIFSGGTYSTDLPVSGDALQSSNAGGGDGFVTILSADLQSLVFSTYVGGTGDDYGRSLDVNASGVVVAGGETDSDPDFPVLNAEQATYGGGYSDGTITTIQYNSP